MHWDGHPIRTAGVLFVLVLALPGTLAGVNNLLCVVAGVGLGLPAVSAATHGMTQVGGAFMVLIWGFLTHALPGMLGADDVVVRRIREPLVALGACVVLAWGAEAWGDGALQTFSKWAVAAVSLWGTAILLDAAVHAQRSVWKLPFPFLLLGLLAFPVGTILWALSGHGVVPPRAATEVVLRVALVPIILAMAYQMVGSLLQSAAPRRWPWTAGMLAWVAGAGLLASGTLATPARILQGVGAFAVLASLPVFRVRQGLFGRVKQDAGWRALRAHVVVGLLCLAAGPWVDLAGEVFPLKAWALGDLGRHLVAMGFCLGTVMGITQRVLPNFVHGRASSGAWMWLNWGLLTSSLVLRAATVGLPDTGPLVVASAALGGVAVLSYAVHLGQGLLWPADPSRRAELGLMG